jgi:LmbE family N-acetylglucosaminyl deacetylase
MAADLLVLSPHCDDAVFGCGDFLGCRPGALVATVFAGRPEPGTPLTPWDEAAGFGPGDDVVGMRRAEDHAALSLLEAYPLWLPFRDSQYGPSPRVDDLATAIQVLLAWLAPRRLAVPLGLFHSDHALVHEAALAVAEKRPTEEMLVYEDAIYRRLASLVAERVRRLARRGWRLGRPRAQRRPASPRKRWAVRCYRSQLTALATPGRPGHADVFTEERLWMLER